MRHFLKMDKTEFDRIRRQVRRESGLCVHCGKEDAYTMNGRALCFECSEKRNSYLKLHRAKPEVRIKKSEQAKKLRQERKKSGLCTSCGNPVVGGYSTCEFCRSRMRKYNASYRMRKNPSINYPRGENGICYQCNKNPSITGKRLCDKCYEKAILRIKKINVDCTHSKTFRMENDLFWKISQNQKSV